MTPNTTKFSKILLFSFKLVIVVFCWIIFCNTDSDHHVQAMRYDTTNLYLRSDRYKEIKLNYSLVDPFVLPKENLRVTDLEDLTNCTCPRVFYPACGYNKETYFNICVLKCINQTTIRRLGPCITYRRMNGMVLNLSIPASWKDPNSIELQADDELENVVLEVPVQ